MRNRREATPPGSRAQQGAPSGAAGTSRATGPGRLLIAVYGTLLWIAYVWVSGWLGWNVPAVTG